MEQLELLVVSIAGEYSPELTDSEKESVLNNLGKAADIYVKVTNAEVQSVKLMYEHEEKLEQIKLEAAVQESREIREDRKADFEEQLKIEELENSKQKLKNEKLNISAESVCKIILGVCEAGVTVLGLINTAGIFSAVRDDDAAGKLYFSQGVDLWRSIFTRKAK